MTQHTPGPCKCRAHRDGSIDFCPLHVKARDMYTELTRLAELLTTTGRWIKNGWPLKDYAEALDLAEKALIAASKARALLREIEGETA